VYLENKPVDQVSSKPDASGPQTNKQVIEEEENKKVVNQNSLRHSVQMVQTPVTHGSISDLGSDRKNGPRKSVMVKGSTPINKATLFHYLWNFQTIIKSDSHMHKLYQIHSKNSMEMLKGLHADYYDELLQYMDEM